MVILGLWLAIIGYGITYAGVVKLGGDFKYSIRDGFTGKAPAGPSGPGAQAAGTTTADQRAANAAAQAAAIATSPLAGVV